MDINRLLSPTEPRSGRDDSSASPSSTPTSSPGQARPLRPNDIKRTSSGLHREIVRSPDRSPTSLPSHSSSSLETPPLAQHSLAGFRQLEQTTPSNSAPRSNDAVHTPQHRPTIVHRSSSRLSSTSQMDTLTDLASSHRQSMKRADSSNSVNSHSSFATQRSHPLIHHSVAKVTMDEAPARTPTPRAFVSSALSEAELSTVTSLLSYLSENSYAFDSHVQLVTLLHKGFLANTRLALHGSSVQSDPHTYNLLSELRQARNAMDSRFAVGEAIWLDWLSDEMMLATSSDDRLAVTELCQKAVQDEPASLKIWQAYVSWIESNYAASHSLEATSQSGWSDEDKEICRELFTQEMLSDVLEQAIAATQWRIDESHLLWNRYVEVTHQLSRGPNSREEFEKIQDVFIRRLQIPHTGWDETAQLLWPLISKFHGSNWEAVMSEITEMTRAAKSQMLLRDKYEAKLQQAIAASDNRIALFDEFTRYLKWEKHHKQHASFDKELLCALYERALLQFPAYTEWWIDYVDLVISQQPSSHNPSSSVLPLIERATRHCPWSGELWARRILRSDVERKSHDDIEGTKHRATNSGLLHVGGMEDLLKVLIEWCNYLRRHAFTSTSSEYDIDTAELGITAALEDVQQAGRKVYGNEFHGDPLYRLEQVQIKFLSESRRMDDARAIWRDLVQNHHTSHEFWLRYYNWELTIWLRSRMNDQQRVETTETGPHLPTAVVQEALSQRDLDWPEKVADMYMDHFQRHECVEKLQTATIEAREFSKKIQAKRAREAEEAAIQSAQQLEDTIAAPTTGEPSGEKRKRETDFAQPEESAKRSKTVDTSASKEQEGEQPSSASAQIKRDRENCTLTVQNLSSEVTELDIRKLFRDCGTIQSINILLDDNEDTASATVEFEFQEDVETARTRNGRDLLGREVHIRSGSQSTLYVANYPPEYDEVAIRSLFEAYGEITSVRFPSLKFNNRRRFCYVQFLLPEQAKAAESAMNDKALDGSHRLLAKISDPNAKKQRSGAQAEGRELFVKNLENAAPEKEVKAFFEQYGNVVSINLLKNVTGKRLGTGFVVFSSTDEATKAVEQTNHKPFRDRILQTSMSTPKGGTAPLEKARKTDIIIKHSASPEPTGAAVDGARRGSDVSMASASNVHDNDEKWKTIRERQVAIFNVPDTVQDARITAEMEKHGSVVKLQLRRDKNAAIVEFADLKAAFDVREGIDCTALGPETRTGDVKDLFAKSKPKGDGASLASAPMKPASLSRPGQRGGRRGGLGFKRGGFGGGNKATASEQTQQNGTPARSNADFKAIFEQSKK